ncbi:cupin domain-containing protein [Pantanalinema sp. GBBB05]|uniref:cupin domain-containing protein n=1 Tax=Pantanalinema sp. GBBB05 TaxID=2604139 RepID=UPI001D94B9F5|nr:anti-sigma factor [Pantanalinema sp. GBBB05]
MTTEKYCFCELAPLYAIDQLSEEERGWVEQQIVECPDLAEELIGYQLGMTAMAYTVPSLPMDSTLKDRLFDQLELDPAQSTVLPQYSFVSYQAIRSQELNWQPHPTPGVEVAIVHTDEMKREIVGFLRAEPGVHYPLHRHAAIEEIFMLEGDLVVGNEVYGAGDYIRSHPGSTHAPYTIGGCRFFFHTSMDDEYPELVGVSSLT